MSTPAQAARSPLKKAVIEVVVPAGSRPPITLQLNPTELQVQKQNQFQEIAVPGLEVPPLQYIRGAAEQLSVELLADTTDTLGDVREEYVRPVRQLMDIESELHAPPILRFSWDRQVFYGVLESLQVTYTLFSPEGRPLRAKMALTFKEYRSARVQTAEHPRLSPDFDKAYVVRAGDTLASIAAASFQDPTLWREVARASGVRDPRRLVPGQLLSIPRLR